MEDILEIPIHYSAHINLYIIACKQISPAL